MSLQSVDFLARLIFDSVNRRKMTTLRINRTKRSIPGILAQCSLKVDSVGRRGGGLFKSISIPTPVATTPTGLPPLYRDDEDP